ncbi:hypothetical protein MRX96_029240 [Rhipicephalus microplus]
MGQTALQKRGEEQGQDEPRARNCCSPSAAAPLLHHRNLRCEKKRENAHNRSETENGDLKLHREETSDDPGAARNDECARLERNGFGRPVLEKKNTRQGRREIRGDPDHRAVRRERGEQATAVRTVSDRDRNIEFELSEFLLYVRS